MTKSKNCYDENLVLDQLKYLGMLEIIRIRKQGFPVHLPFEDFLSRYKCLVRGKCLPADRKQAVG